MKILDLLYKLNVYWVIEKIIMKEDLIIDLDPDPKTQLALLRAVYAAPGGNPT